MRLPIDAEVLSPVNDESAAESQVDTAVQLLLESRERVFKTAECNISAAQRKQKETYDRKHQPEEIAVGRQVLLENTQQKQRKGGKLQPAWLGPYVIHQSLGKGLYELSKDGKVVKKKANIARLKIYRKRAADDGTEATDPLPKKSKVLMIVIFTHCVRNVFHLQEMWVEELDLSTADREELLDSSVMLNDKHIQAAHDLLRKQFPQLGGLQCSLLSQTDGFKSVSGDGKTMYVLDLLP